MASETQLKYDTPITATHTFGGLAAAAAEQTAAIENTDNRPGALVYVKIKSSGSPPTAGRQYRIYLLRRDDHASPVAPDDGAGVSAASITILNAKLLGLITVTNSATTNFYGTFDTADLGPLGPSYAFALYNDTNQSIDATDGNHVIKVLPYYQEAQ